RRWRGTAPTHRRLTNAAPSVYCAGRSILAPRRSPGHPALGLLDLVEPVGRDFAWCNPGEQTHRRGDPLDIGDEREPPPGGVVATPRRGPCLQPLQPRAWLEPAEVGQDEQQPKLARLGSAVQSRLDDLAIILATELARGLKPPRPRRHVLYRSDHAQ